MNAINDFEEFYLKITATSSRLEKEAILKAYQNHAAVKEVLHFLFNPFIVTGISKKKLGKTVNLTVQKCQDLHALLAYFTVHNTGRDEDIAVLKQFTSELNEAQTELVHGIIKKDCQR